MQHVDSAEYQIAVEEAANAFMKVMALRGFVTRDYPQNLVAHMAKQTRFHFASNRVGAHPQADEWVAAFIRPGQMAEPAAAKAKPKAPAFSMLRRRTV